VIPGDLFILLSAVDFVLHLECALQVVALFFYTRMVVPCWSPVVCHKFVLFLFLLAE